MAVAWSQVLGQYYLKSQIDNLWSIFMLLQLVDGFKEYSVRSPSNYQMVLDEVGSFINLKMANPNSILKTINPDWSISALLGVYKNKGS